MACPWMLAVAVASTPSGPGGAERPHQGACFAEVDARHRGKEVMFDLIIQAAEDEVRESIGRDVARAQDLSFEEGKGCAWGPGGHALVIRSDGQREIEAGENLAEEKDR